MPTQKTQSKQAPKAQPYIASLLDDIKKNSAKSPSPTSTLSGAQMTPRASTSSPSSSSSGASVTHHARATPHGSESGSSKTLSRASSTTCEERRNSAAAPPLPLDSREPAASVNYNRSTPRAAPAASPRERDQYDSLESTSASDKRRGDITALSRPLESHEPQVSLNYGASDSDLAKPPAATKASGGEPHRSISRSPRRIGSEGLDTAASRRYSAPSEDGECSPPHSRRSPTPTGDFYRPAPYSRSSRGNYQDRYDDYASRRRAVKPTAREPQRRKADTYRPRQQSPVEQQRDKRIAQEVAQSIEADLNQLQQRNAGRPKKIQRDNKGRPILAKYRKDEQPESATPVPKEASKRASTQASSKTKKVKKAKEEDDDRRDSGMSLSKSPAALSGPSTNVQATGKKSKASAWNDDTPRRTDDEASKKPVQSKKRARPTADPDQDDSTEQAPKKPKLSKAEPLQEAKKISSFSSDVPEDLITVAPERKKLVPKMPAPSKSKANLEAAEVAAPSPAPKTSRKRKPVKDEVPSSSDSSSEDDTPLIQLRPAKKQKAEQAAVIEDISARSGESSSSEVEDIAPKAKVARKVSMGKKQLRGIPAEEREKGVAYKKLADGSFVKQERVRKVGATKPKVQPKAPNYNFFK